MTQTKPQSRAVPDGMKRVVVTKFGDGKVHNGKGAHKNDQGRIVYGKCAQGDELIVPVKVAENLEAKGFAEIA